MNLNGEAKVPRQSSAGIRVSARLGASRKTVIPVRNLKHDATCVRIGHRISLFSGFFCQPEPMLLGIWCGIFWRHAPSPEEAYS